MKKSYEKEGRKVVEQKKKKYIVSESVNERKVCKRTEKDNNTKRKR